MERKGRDHRHGSGKAPTCRKRTPRRTPCKNVAASAPRDRFSDGARFEFQKRMARIDWRTLHTIDVDCIIREVDIDTLESVLDTVTFGDIQGEDTRNFTEANFVKIFRLAQLMVEYLLHVQDLLADHKSGLLQSRANMEQRNEKVRSRYLWQRDALLQTRHELEQAKKTLRTYEAVLKVQEKNNQIFQSSMPQVRHCPFCEKAFKSSYYLDIHVVRKHLNKQEVTDDKILAVVSTAEEATAAQAGLRRAETNSNTQIEGAPVQLSMRKERRGSSPRERWIDTDEALRVLARPTSGRRRAEKIPEEPSEGKSSPDPKHDTYSTSPVKRALRSLSPERMRMSYKERPKKPSASKELKLRGGGDNPSMAEEMRTKLEWEMAAAHEEHKKHQKSVEQRLAKEKRKMGKRRRGEDRGSSKAATQYSKITSKSETSSESIAPLLLALPEKLETISPSSTIHTARKIVSNRAEIERIQPKPGPLPGTRIHPFHSPPPYKPGPCCKRPLHFYLRHGIGNPQTPPRTSFHRAVLSSNPDLKNVTRNRIPNHTVPPSKEHVIEHLSAVTRELGKYFPTEKPKVKCGTSSRSAQPTIPDIETTDTETNETEIPRLHEISEVAAMEFGEVANTIPETQTETKTEMQDETENDLSAQLSKELKRFGITSNTNGISDTTYKSISSALEMQRSVRMSQIHGDERQIVEYERDAVVWHTQMAVRERDLVTVKSPFNVVTGSESKLSYASEDSVEESGRSNNSDEFDCEFGEDSREREMKPGSASDVRSSEQSSPRSSERSDDIQEAEATCKSSNMKWAKHSKADDNVHLGPRSPPSKRRVQYVSGTYSSEPTLKQANSSRNIRDPPSQVQLIRSIADVVDHTRQSEEEEVDEDAFGLGVWDSDEDKAKEKCVKN